MTITGDLLIGRSARRGTGAPLVAIDPSTGHPLTPEFNGAAPAQVAEACRLADEAFDVFRRLPLNRRAAFLEAIADGILALGDELIVRGMAETGLPRARLEGERGRTVGQLRMFADVVRSGDFLGVRIDPALPERSPLPRPDLRLRNIPLGPVAVFAASNFPLAFSVAGGDTASALAAGCPVVAKAHTAHLGVSELVGRAVQEAAVACDMPEGVFSLVFGQGVDIGQQLAADPHIKAIGFTGSRGGGTALMRTAAVRPEPIPVYAEMSSINPVVLLQGALGERAEQIARDFVASLTLGAGQFCTNPGLILAADGPELDRFLRVASEVLQATEAAIMLSEGIHGAYCQGVTRLREHADVTELAAGRSAQGYRGSAALFETCSKSLLADPHLQEEVFGAAGLVVRCADDADIGRVIEALEGQLTAAVHLADSDLERAGALLPILERKAGRVLFNGFGTGVEVAHAMVHGGPYPSTADGRSTSVGSLAIDRFLRPVCYQNLPEPLQPDELKDENPQRLARRLDGKLTLPAA